MQTIEKTYKLPFSPQQVYAAWVSSNTVVPPATKMDIKPVVGGHYRLVMETPDFTATNEGTFSVVEPGKRVVYSWEWNKDGEVTQIEVNFRPAEIGTTVHIVHSGFERDDSVAAHDSGWDSYIKGFTALMERECSQRSVRAIQSLESNEASSDHDTSDFRHAAKLAVRQSMLEAVSGPVGRVRLVCPQDHEYGRIVRSLTARLRSKYV